MWDVGCGMAERGQEGIRHLALGIRKAEKNVGSRTHQWDLSPDVGQESCQRSAFSQKAAEAGLLEVAIAGEGLGEPVLLHDDEGDAVGERPVLVVA